MCQQWHFALVPLSTRLRKISSARIFWRNSSSSTLFTLVPASNRATILGAFAYRERVAVPWMRMRSQSRMAEEVLARRVRWRRNRHSGGGSNFWSRRSKHRGCLRSSFSKIGIVLVMSAMKTMTIRLKTVSAHRENPLHYLVAAS